MATTTHTFSTDTDPSLFLEVDDGTGKPARLAAGSNVLVRNAADGSPLAGTTALPLGYLSFTTTDVPAVQVSAGSGVWKGPFYSKEARAAAVTGAGAGSDLLDPNTGQIKPELIPGGALTGNYAELDPNTGQIDAAAVPDLSATYDVAGSADAVSSDLQTFKTQVPSNEDLMFVWSAPGRYGDTITSGSDYVVMTAPMDITILSASMVWDDSNAFAGITASDTNYWKVNINVNGTKTVRTTQVTGADANGGIVPERDWNFDAAVWQVRDLLKGQPLLLNFGPVGSPSPLGEEFALTIRYQRKAS